MSELLIKILEKINSEDNIYKICTDLKISINQFNYYLSILKNNYFYNFTRFGSRNGNIILKDSPKKAGILSNNNMTRILSIPNNQEKDYIRTVFISDLHIGSTSGCTKEFLQQVYKYCNENNIHLIFCNGDWIDGINEKGEQLYKDPRNQAEELINVIPFDNNICVIGVEGDHDYNLCNFNFNFESYIQRYRSDIIILGNNTAKVAMGKDYFEIFHKRPKIEEIKKLLCFSGHLHKFSMDRFTSSDSSVSFLNVGVPSASTIFNSIPSCLMVTFELNNGLIKNIYTKQLISINSNLEPINEITQIVRKRN